MSTLRHLTAPRYSLAARFESGTNVVTHSHSTGRRKTSLRLVDQTRLVLLIGPSLLAILLSCVAFFATMGGLRYAAAVLGYPSLWMLMLAVHHLTEPPLIITLPDHPQHRAMIENQKVTARSPRRRATGRTALCMLWAAWGGVLYLPLLLSPTIDIAFAAATAGLAIHAIICGVLGIRACRAWVYSLLISLERLNLSLATHGDLVAVTPALLRIELRRTLGPAIGGRTAMSLSLLRVVAATDRGWLSSASQRRMRDQALAPIT